jgi:LmbE family N-acetylglucosaminyl deacetylase
MIRTKIQIKTTADVKRLGTILSVWAHPDDESFLAAGIMAAAVRNGQKVICVTATKGEAGSQDKVKWPPVTLGDVRAKEMDAALKLLGIKQHQWLGFHDGECEKTSIDAAATKLKKLFVKYRPDSVLTFGPDGWTGHPDHSTVSHWVDNAAAASYSKTNIFHYVGTPEHFDRFLKPADEKLNIFFNIDQPPIVEPEKCAIYFKLPPEIRKLKRAALAAMPSQTEVLLKLFDREFIDKAFALETYVQVR